MSGIFLAWARHVHFWVWFIRRKEVHGVAGRLSSILLIVD